MTRNSQPSQSPDIYLVAYLDGELSPAESVRVAQRIANDPSLKARLDQLTAGGRAFRDSFDPLIALAPVERLEAGLARSLQRSARSGRFQGSAVSSLAAAAVVALVVGASLDRATVTWTAKPSAVAAGGEDAEWRNAVAGYLALYTPETLARIPAQDGAGELAGVGDRLGLALSADKVAFGDLILKRADLYDYDGKPLAFLAYLDPKDGPVALCIMAGSESPEPGMEKRRDLNSISWSQGSRSFMLLGRAPAARLQALAAEVRTRFANDSEGRG